MSIYDCKYARKCRYNKKYTKCLRNSSIRKGSCGPSSCRFFKHKFLYKILKG